MTHHLRPEFAESVARAFESLAADEHSGGGRGASSGTEWTRLRGVPAAEHMQLLGMLTSDFSPQASDLMLKRFCRPEGSLVPFASFRASVACCRLYADYIGRAERLFRDLDLAKTGALSRDLDGGGRVGR